MRLSRIFPDVTSLCASFLILFLSIVALPLDGAAQSPGEAGEPPALVASDYDEWEGVAQRAEDAIEQDRASQEAFDQLRAELVDWRSRFETAQSANSAAISAVQAQLDTLGPAPENGDEPTALAQQRSDLTARLEELASPARQAEIAYSRADALIRSIDANLRARQTQALMEIGPSPLDPSHWPGALEDVATFAAALAGDVMDNWNDPNQRQVFRQNLPVIAFLVLLAMVLVLRGRGWIERLALSVLDQKQSAARWLFSFIVSLGQIGLPVIGLAVLAAAGTTSGLLGQRGETIAQSIVGAGTLFFFTRWLAAYVFPVSERAGLMLQISQTQLREGRVYANVLGLVLALYVLAREAITLEGWDAGTRSVLLFPLIVVTGLSLLRVARFLILHGRADPDDEDGARSFRQQIVLALGRTVALLAVLGPALASVGYLQAGQALTFRMLYSLELLSFLLIMQKLVGEIYIVFTGDRDRASEALLPVLLSFALTVATLPVFALIWGARRTDLGEAWAQFRAGFDIGDTHISPGDFLIFVLVFVAGYAMTRLLQGAMRTSILPKTKLDKGGQNAVISGLGYVGIFLAALIAITTAGIDLSSLAIVAGALSVGVGFGLQTIVSNFVSGIILLIERPISEGDWIEVGGQMGFVRSISVRSTRIETFDRTDVIVPNADLISNQVTNWTRGNLIGRLIVPVGVAYGSDTRKVAKILQDVAEEQPLVLLNPPPGVVFTAFGGDSLNFEIRAILRDVTQILDVQTEMHHRIAERFREEKIEIPFAQRDIWLRNPEALREASHPLATQAVPPQTEQDSEAQADQTPLRPSHLTQDDLPDGSADTDGDGDGGGGDR
ncbi:Mechanosensitive channel MscK precursor [Pseudooceanicola marinus]|uniref:Mechanosensitive channel MscK n=1 Tax=Pseudooceanicola marinus TaxID=396013 RepID=A0A1X6YNF5_9RHOB|nr:DUF3772 domain-containing protein [Pseudooceanicola marinus]PJE29333.1 DUF3772 domain-containing protein [Pseudooceanicola marinus]SLN24603.1 Mechanosensitive channel MscK precursor [Pseudooceanicola marinus]